MIAPCDQLYLAGKLWVVVVNEGLCQDVELL